MPAPRKPKSKRQAPATKSKASKPKVKLAAPSAICLGPEACTDLAASLQREWLVTNGIGGFASGTVAGSATRRYHGLLMAALDPPPHPTPLGRGVDEMASIDGQAFELATHRWASGAVAPRGYLTI